MLTHRGNIQNGITSHCHLSSVSLSNFMRTEHRQFVHSYFDALFLFWLYQVDHCTLHADTPQYTYTHTLTYIQSNWMLFRVQDTSNLAWKHQNTPNSIPSWWWWWWRRRFGWLNQLLAHSKIIQFKPVISSSNLAVNLDLVNWRCNKRNHHFVEK